MTTFLRCAGRLLLAAALAHCLALAGCKPRQQALAVPPPAPEVVPASAPASAEAGFSFRLVPGAIEVRRGAQATPWQRLELPADAEAPEVDVLDMNFDGHADLRVIAQRGAGPNVSYLNWLFDPDSGRFAPSTALNALIAPEYDADHDEVVASWRDGPTRYISEVHAWRDGKLVPVVREVKTYRTAGRYSLQRLRWDGRRWKRVERRNGRD